MGGPEWLYPPLGDLEWLYQATRKRKPKHITFVWIHRLTWVNINWRRFVIIREEP